MPFPLILFILIILQLVNTQTTTDEFVLGQLCAHINSRLPASWDCEDTSTACTWQGVNCTDGAITQLSLKIDGGTQDLINTLPSELALLNVTKLSIIGMGLSGTIPSQLSTMTLLQQLFLTSNALSGSIPIFPALRVLVLRGNKFTDLPVLEPIVEFLDLSQNYIEDAIPSLILSPVLTFLDISYNQVSGTVPAWLATLDYCDLSYNRLVNVTQDDAPGVLNFFPQDIDDCLEGTHLCESSCIDGWFPPLSYTCACPDLYALGADQRTCEACLIGPLEPLPIVNYTSFPSMVRLGYPEQNLSYASCSSCDYGSRYSSRPFLNNPACDLQIEEILAVKSCSFACSNLTDITMAREAIRTLVNQFQKSDFLQSIATEFFGFNLSFVLPDKNTKKRLLGIGFLDWFLVSGSFIIDVDPCDSLETEPLDNFKTLTESLAYDIVPNIPSLTVTLSYSDCAITLRSQDPDPITPIVLTIVIVSVFLTCLSGCAVFFCVKRNNYLKSPLRRLPKELAWSFLKYERHPEKWDHRGTKNTKYYFREFDVASKYGQRVIDLFNSRLNGSEIKIVKIEAIYNEQLTASFVNMRTFLQQRRNNAPNVFGGDTTRGDQTKKWVLQKLIDFTNSFPWNEPGDTLDMVSIVPALHGTDLATARSIAETGFAAISLLDSGFFGKGIYFTTFASYTVPYLFPKRDPVIILAWIVCGSTYPVTEAKTLRGAALQGTCNSHYVVTDRHGQCITDQKTDPSECFNEIVLGQESQIMPAFLLTVGKENLGLLIKKWNRPVILQDSSPYSDSACESTDTLL